MFTSKFFHISNMWELCNSRLLNTLKHVCLQIVSSFCGTWLGFFAFLHNVNDRERVTVVVFKLGPGNEIRR